MDAPSWTPLPTEDGSYTFFSDAFGETFHSTQGAKTEAFQKFVEATDLSSKAQRPSLCLLDVCYGLGYNTAAALETLWRINPTCQVYLYGLELDATVPVAAIAPACLQDWSPAVQGVLRSLARTQTCRQDRIQAQLLIGDARQTIQTVVQHQFQAEAIFFDPFSPRCCPQLWTVEFFQAVAQCLARDGRLSTYSRSAAVRSALQEAGLQIGTIPPLPGHLPHEWSQGTVAAWTSAGLTPFSLMEQEHLQTRAAIPLRDPNLSDMMAEILARHEQEQQVTVCESTSSWRRRWGIR
ncbi:MAG: MnmC family methyltransferase [Thermosynechococcaceae cyanobacterium]